ncbi:MAG: thiamine pyrophosphate-binding protein [Actinobacteria bacterium]|nr:thiamine pyrophosphate-binding protein [Actinomycetota bacterium]
MSGAFYRRFERHGHGEGLKAYTTHYCAGCGHGLAHRYLAEAIEALEVADRAVVVSPVGCSVFLYYYLDTGNTQAAHGRAPAVALGHKVANPDSVVITYQGDGDLASIGLAEIMYCAQLGLPMTVVFINNANYGMTGGQMAPTTLLGQPTTTTPEGRSAFEGPPLKVAEMIAVLDGPAYVERVALFDSATRNRARRAIRRAVEVQAQDGGFALVEVLSECPVQLGLDTLEAEKWVRDHMVPVFPLGVKKEPAGLEPWPRRAAPSFDADRVLAQIGAVAEAPSRFASGFPAHIAEDDIGIKLAGSGGDGAQTAALLLTRAAVNEGYDATHIPSYGPESRGGTSYADVRIARDEVLSPAAPSPHILVAFNGPSVRRFGAAVAAGGCIVYDSGLVDEVPKDLASGVRVVGVPFGEIAAGLGNRMVKNIVALGVLQAATGLFPEATMQWVISRALGKKKGSLARLNDAAFESGIEAGRAASSG